MRCPGSFATTKKDFAPARTSATRQRGGGVPLEMECMACGVTYEPEPEDTIVHVFDEADYNCVITACIMCKQKYFLFFDDPRYLLMGYTVTYSEEAPDWLKDVYGQLTGNPPDEEPKQLTCGKSPDEVLDEGLIVVFHDWIERAMPDDFQREW